MTVVAQPARGGYDVVVIGSGPAGLTVAKKLDELTASKILVVESGTEEIGDARDLAKVEAEGDLSATHFARHSVRAFGGTSSIWVGWCAVLDERPFLDNQWPLPYGELYGYYPEAARILNVPPVVHERPEVPLVSGGSGGVAGNIVYRPWYFSDPVRFGSVGRPRRGFARFGAGHWIRDSASVDVLFGHTATKLVNRHGVVEGVSLVHSHAQTTRDTVHVAAERVVVAAGGIQNARLLQLSLGKVRPALGLGLAEHPHVKHHGRFEIDKDVLESVMDRARRPSAPPGERVEHGIGLSSSFCKERSAMSLTIRLRSLSVVRALLAGRRKAVFAGDTEVRAEMASVESNKVELGSRMDALGQPGGRVVLKFDYAPIEHNIRMLNSELVRAGIGRLRVGAAPSLVRQEGRPWLHGGGHMMGTTRMGKDPSRSVTDGDGRVHGFSNLYVAGSSLFPAASAANPTLTIVALALRLAKHLAAQAR